MAEITQTIPSITNIPDRINDSPEQFSENAILSLEQQQTFSTAINTFSGQANAVRNEMVALDSNVTSNASTSAANALSASNSADAAAASEAGAAADALTASNAASAAESSETNAAASALAASNSEIAAAVSETNAASSAATAISNASTSTANASSALASKNAAAVSEESAEADAILAQSAANSAAIQLGDYQGEFVSGTTYQIGQSVSYDDSIWIAKNTTTITPQKGENWLKGAGTAGNKDVQAEPTDDTAGRVLTVNAHPMVMFIDPYKKSIEHASGGRNTVIYDDQGNPNVMVVVPRMNYEDLDLPDLNLGTGTMTAFTTNGVPRSEILISKYINSTGAQGTGFASIGGNFPRNYINFDTAKNLCTAKGDGWHMLSHHEWEMLKFISLGTVGNTVRGNTYWGRSHEQRIENATRVDGLASGYVGGDGRTRTGQGANSWSHDGTAHGVMDMVGNVWEWTDQFKIVDGQIFVTADNDPDALEVDWIATGVFYDGTGGLRLSDSVVSTGSYNVGPASSIGESATYVQSELMRRLGIEHASADVNGRLYANNSGERLPFRGGHWVSASGAGLGVLSLNNARSNSFNSIGGRSAYFT